MTLYSIFITFQSMKIWSKKFLRTKLQHELLALSYFHIIYHNHSQTMIIILLKKENQSVFYWDSESFQENMYELNKPE